MKINLFPRLAPKPTNPRRVVDRMDLALRFWLVLQIVLAVLTTLGIMGR